MDEPGDTTRFDGRSEFQQAVRRGFAHAADVGSLSLCCCDADFADWPLNDAALIDDLVRWARPGRRLTMLAVGYDEVIRHHPRFVEWRRRFAHLVDCRAVDEADARAVPSLLLSAGGVTLRRVDELHHRGTVSTQVADAIHARERFDALLQRSVPSMPAYTLGL